MKRRVRKDHTQESREILLFILDTFKLTEGTIVFVKEVFERYQAWRKREGLADTEISILSFGKLFPKYFKREVKCRDRQVDKAFIGVSFK